MLKDMDNLLRMEKISKSFPGVKALDSVHFELKRGEVHAIAGENGAGKSTFMKVLTGIYKQDEGEIYYKGNLFLPENPKHAQEMGISIIHQELNLLPDLSVANNIYISREPRKVRGIIDDKEMNEKAQALLDSMGLSINAQTEVKDLSIASRQMVEIAKALSVHSECLSSMNQHRRFHSLKLKHSSILSGNFAMKESALSIFLIAWKNSMILLIGLLYYETANT